MNYPDSKEAVALELTKLIMSGGFAATTESVLELYSECLGVVNGHTLELQRATMKREKASVAKIP
jgi:hypothetical protein